MRRSLLSGRRLIVVAAVVFVGLLLVEGTWAFTVSQVPPLTVTVNAKATPLAGWIVNFTARTGTVSAALHLALVPGRSAPNPDHTVLFFADAQYPTLYASPTTIFGAASRLGAYLALQGSGDRVVVVNGEDLGAALADHPTARLLMIGTGIVPTASSHTDCQMPV